MAKPLVSVIIPVHNGERYLATALASVLGQDYRPIEIIVVDDGSSDRTSYIARAFAEVHYIVQPNRGVAAARNVGISASHGQFIAFLDADDLWMPNKLSAQINYLLANPQIGYAFARMTVFLEPGVDSPGWLKKDLLSQDQVGYIPSALVVRKAVFDRVGVFDPAYRIGEDSDWFCRAKDAGVPLGVLSEVLLCKRIHDANLSAQTHIGSPNLLKLLKESMDRRRVRATAEGEQRAER